jgi:hypothetical protein
MCAVKTKLKRDPSRQPLDLHLGQKQTILVRCAENKLQVAEVDNDRAHVDFQTQIQRMAREPREETHADGLQVAKE